jgi:hypothetical protein
VNVAKLLFGPRRPGNWKVSPDGNSASTALRNVTPGMRSRNPSSLLTLMVQLPAGMTTVALARRA